MTRIDKQYIEKLNANDVEYKIAALTKSDGEFTKKGEVIAVIETSKVASEIRADYAGFIYFPVTQDQKIVMGDLLAIFASRLTNKASLFDDNEVSVNKNQEHPQQEIIISKPALALIKKHNIDQNVFKDMALVKQSDVLSYLSNHLAKSNSS